MDLHIESIECDDDNGEWVFRNKAGDAVATHVTAGHMAAMYRELQAVH